MKVSQIFYEIPRGKKGKFKERLQEQGYSCERGRGTFDFVIKKGEYNDFPLARFDKSRFSSVELYLAAAEMVEQGRIDLPVEYARDVRKLERLLFWLDL
jgi:hypothetical protein